MRVVLADSVFRPAHRLMQVCNLVEAGFEGFSKCQRACCMVDAAAAPGGVQWQWQWIAPGPA
jgi:hypothetical protein